MVYYIGDGMIALAWFDKWSNVGPLVDFVSWRDINKLKTQDKLKDWEVQNVQILVCPLCSECQDSHPHLFFECNYSSTFWNYALQYMLISNSYEWAVVASDIVGRRSDKSAASLVAKLLFAVAVYFIWQEKNSRLFNSKRRYAKDLFGVIYSSVRLKLLPVRFKESRQIEQLRIAWKL
ncbi:uncharacterized protein [Rutidosis leptorrhynchoides]|uniref:uncharacterized protein n=1 Tax=Rutidosis leptorrhynchoides TaxID=125765 RepID=UPI003A9930D7